MSRYRLALSIDDEIVTETQEEAWRAFVESIKQGYYGPTRDNVELLEEVPIEEIIPAGE